MFDITSIQSSTYAAIATYLSTIFTIISFSTPYWLASDGVLAKRQFENLGLWEVCFIRFEDPNYLYDRILRGCIWIFNEDYRFLSHVLEPSFFIATQVLFTLGFLFLLISVAGILAVQLCFIVEKVIIPVTVLSIITSLSALFSTIAVVIFGIRGDDRDWMPDPDHNFLSWSFGLAVVAVLLQWLSAALFWVETRVLYKRSIKNEHDAFSMEATRK